MYEKPEVTKYGGKELLDLMGPVETAYCDLDGAQGFSDGECYIEYTLQMLGGRDVDDFEGLYLMLSGPCGTDSTTCDSPDSECLISGGEDPEPGDTELDFAIDICDFCGGENGDGLWTLKAQLIEDGERLQDCNSMDPFEDPRE